jgi:hypothetical protein
MSFIFKMMLVLYQIVSISGPISNIYWHASKRCSISFSHWQCPSDREFSFPRSVGLLILSLCIFNILLNFYVSLFLLFVSSLRYCVTLCCFFRLGVLYQCFREVRDLALKHIVVALVITPVSLVNPDGWHRRPSAVNNVVYKKPLNKRDMNWHNYVINELTQTLISGSNVSLLGFVFA